jgi:hypothetical protein
MNKKIFIILSGTVSDIGSTGGFNSTLAEHKDLHIYYDELKKFLDIKAEYLPEISSNEYTFRLTYVNAYEKNIFLLSVYIAINPNNNKSNRGAFFNHTVILFGFPDPKSLDILISQSIEHLILIRKKYFKPNINAFHDSIKNVNNIEIENFQLEPYILTTVDTSLNTIRKNDHSFYIYLRDLEKTENNTFHENDVTRIYSKYLFQSKNQTFDTIILPTNVPVEVINDRISLIERFNNHPNQIREAILPQYQKQTDKLSDKENNQITNNIEPEPLDNQEGNLFESEETEYRLIKLRKLLSGVEEDLKNALNKINSCKEDDHKLQDRFILGHIEEYIPSGKLLITLAIVLVFVFILIYLFDSSNSSENHGNSNEASALTDNFIHSGKPFFIQLAKNENSIDEGCGLSDSKKDNSPLKNLRLGSFYKVTYMVNKKIWSVEGVNQGSKDCTELTKEEKSESEDPMSINIWGIKVKVNERDELLYDTKLIGYIVR